MAAAVHVAPLKIVSVLKHYTIKDQSLALGAKVSKTYSSSQSFSGSLTCATIIVQIIKLISKKTKTEEA